MLRPLRGVGAPTAATTTTTTTTVAFATSRAATAHITTAGIAGTLSSLVTAKLGASTATFAD